MSAPDPNIRISNAQRETLIGRLHAATEEGRLDLEEFAERSRQVYEAKTYADVERQLADLPEDDRPLAVPDRTARKVPDLVLDPQHSRVRREGSWTVPRRMTIEPKHSAVKLDCRTAGFTSEDVEIALDIAHSSVTIVLPKNASAVDDGVRMRGGKVTNRCYQAGGGPRLHLTGDNNWGRVTIRYERRFLWWRW